MNRVLEHAIARQPGKIAIRAQELPQTLNLDVVRFLPEHPIELHLKQGGCPGLDGRLIGNKLARYLGNDIFAAALNVFCFPNDIHRVAEKVNTRINKPAIGLLDL